MNKQHNSEHVSIEQILDERTGQSRLRLNIDNADGEQVAYMELTDDECKRLILHLMAARRSIWGSV